MFVARENNSMGNGLEYAVSEVQKSYFDRSLGGRREGMVGTYASDTKKGMRIR